jgi:predicted AlkP superfamily pyrophosphatase or phosphodiesterase
MKQRFWTLTLLAILLLACASSTALATPTVAPALAETLIPSATAPPPTETGTPTSTITPTPLPKSSRVLIVSFDGLRPDAIAEANMVNVMALMESGAYTLNAQTIFPPITLPSHSSMLVGTCPAKHIVRWNEYVPQNGYAIGTDLFDLAHAAGLRTVMVVGKEKLRQVTEPASTDYFAFVDDTDKIEDRYRIEQLAIQQLADGFSLMFVHFPNGDLAGHDYGWMSRKQLETYANDDESLGFILESLKGREMYEDTLIIVTSDHGGHETTHGIDVPEDRTIPWVASGPGIHSMQLTAQVHTMDTAATAAFALGLPIPPEWDGLPVYEAYGLPPTDSGGC